MIRTQKEYDCTVKKAQTLEKGIESAKVQYAEKGYSPDEIESLTEVQEGFLYDLQYEIRSYERLCQGNKEELLKYKSINDLGKLLIALRIYSGYSPNELADLLEVHPSQITRDEKNEYKNITLTRMYKILEAMTSKMKNTNSRPLSLVVESKDVNLAFS